MHGNRILISSGKRRPTVAVLNVPRFSKKERENLLDFIATYFVFIQSVRGAEF